MLPIIAVFFVCCDVRGPLPGATYCAILNPILVFLTPPLRVCFASFLSMLFSIAGLRLAVCGFPVFAFLLALRVSLSLSRRKKRRKGARRTTLRQRSPDFSLFRRDQDLGVFFILFFSVVFIWAHDRSRPVLRLYSSPYKKYYREGSVSFFVSTTTTANQTIFSPT